MSSNRPLPDTNTPAAVPEVENNRSVDDSPNTSSLNRWIFDKEKLRLETPSRKVGIDTDKELGYRQEAANFIQDLGNRLQLDQCCLNTAIVYMNRFYMIHSFFHFDYFAISTASIFLAAKVLEIPRPLTSVITLANYCLHRQPNIDPKSEKYMEMSSDLITNENILLQTLGFDFAVEHPHTHVVKCCRQIKASNKLAKTSYHLATNSLYLTTMCLQYKPTVVACVCIYLACKWSDCKIPLSKDGKDWFWYVDETVTIEQLESITTEFLSTVNRAPSRLRRSMLDLKNIAVAAKSLNPLSTHLSTDSKNGEASSADPAESVNSAHHRETQIAQSHSHINSGEINLPSSSHSSNVSYSPKKVASPPPSITPYLSKSKPFELGNSSNNIPTSSSGSCSPPDIKPVVKWENQSDN